VPSVSSLLSILLCDKDGEIRSESYVLNTKRLQYDGLGKAKSE